MTSERSQAYGRVMKTLADLSASKLHGPEQAVIREAADSMFFCEDLPGDPSTRAAFDAVRLLAAKLVEADRMEPETVDRLLADIEDCGPLAPVA